MSTSDILESLIEKDNGYLITSKAVESGVSKPSVSKYVREHDMEKDRKSTRLNSSHRL